jgi:hypothetical protein
VPTPAAPPTSSLDPQEKDSPNDDGLILNQQDPPRPEFQIEPLSLDEARFRHSGWKTLRLRVWQALNHAHVGRTRRDRFANCGSGAYVYYSPSANRTVIRANYCHDRFCVPCANARARRVREAILAQVSGRRVRFATFTLRHSRSALRDQIKRIYAAFAAFRRRREIAQRITGGVAILEVKLSDRDGLWHVHLHCLLEGDYIDQRQLSAHWLAVTGDSSIVDIRSVGSTSDRVAYATKYAAKGLDASVFRDLDRAVEAIHALRSVHLFRFFGTWRQIDINAQGNEVTDWQPVGRLVSLIARAAAGDREAAAWLALLSGVETERDPP